MDLVTKAYAPGNISCIFKIHENPDPAKMGSLGVGFTVDKGVTVEAHLSSKTEIYFNNHYINFPTVKSVIRKLITNKKIHLNINCFSPLPLGGGFGLSGASALASAYAINKLLNLSHSNLELAKSAHIAEVENKTGLGDVVNQYFGGFLLKLKPSPEFKVQKINLDGLPVYCKIFSSLSTKKIISDQKIKKLLNDSSTSALNKIHMLMQDRQKTQIKFSELITISKEFAQNSGLITNKKVISQINKIESIGGHASMIMLGNAVFSDTPFKDSLKLKISNNPAYLL